MTYLEYRVKFQEAASGDVSRLISEEIPGQNASSLRWIMNLFFPKEGIRTMEWLRHGIIRAGSWSIGHRSPIVSCRCNE